MTDLEKVKDFLEWIDKELPNETKDGELTKLGEGMIRIKGLILDTLRKRGDVDVTENRPDAQDVRGGGNEEM